LSSKLNWNVKLQNSKKMKNIIICTIAIALVALVSCSKEFTERGALSGTTVDNYYNTVDEIRGGTSVLYGGLPWAGYQSRAMDCIGDVMAGNTFSYASDYSIYLNFTATATSSYLANAWKSCYKISGWAGGLINAFELKKTLGGNAEALDAAIAECHFIRGLTYFNIARIWGDAPIIEDPAKVALSGQYNIPKYIKSDVIQFAINEVKKAEEGLPEEDVLGRANKNTAKALLSKMYLYIADYANAASYANEVIQSGKYTLVTDYRSMFNSSAYNNCSESVFAIQYQLTTNPWGAGNQLHCDRGPSNLATSESSMWESFIPSLDVKNIWIPGDKRRAGSIMEHEWSMPNWKPQKADAEYNAFMANGYVYDTIQSPDHGGALNGTRSAIAKYIVGPGAAFGGEAVLTMNSGQNFMILRYADILLIYAEAKVRGSVADGTALNAFNEVHKRAGLTPIDLGSLTADTIMYERRCEFAFEGDYWFDIQRQGFTKAKAIISKQNRGTVDAPNYITNFTEEKMHLPIPAGEILQDPELAKPAVPYYSK
jgi:hypothetical protein